MSITNYLIKKEEVVKDKVKDKVKKYYIFSTKGKYNNQWIIHDDPKLISKLISKLIAESSSPNEVKIDYVIHTGTSSEFPTTPKLKWQYNYVPKDVGTGHLQSSGGIFGSLLVVADEFAPTPVQTAEILKKVKVKKIE